jgi:hypothetical protein
MDLDFDNYFNATVTVFWALFFIPYALREKKHQLLGLVSAAMLIAQIVISMHFAHREWPFNFLAGVGSFSFGLMVGYLIYFFESKKQRE